MSTGAGTAEFTVVLSFSKDLHFFLPRSASTGKLTRILREKTSVKDVIESCGVPHTEVDRIDCNGVVVRFDHQLRASSDLQVLGVLEMTRANAARLQTPSITRFVADGHLGKLTRELRLVGLDVAYFPAADDHTLATIASAEDRALLTRDRRLLMRKVIRDGYCVRSTDPDAQLMEVLERYRLSGALAPFTRCIQCNGALAHVSKAEVLAELEPLTRTYYEDFRRCSDCAKIYWSGSHFGRLQARITDIRGRLNRKSEIEIRK